MVILPLSYLFWWKKKWRLALGVAIGAVLVIGFFLPGMIIYSILAKKIKREIKSKRQLEKELDDTFAKSVAQQNSQDQAKSQLEKNIKGLKERIGLLNRIGGRGLGMVEKDRAVYQKKSQEWFSKYGKENASKLLLFSGEEFNQELSKDHKLDWVEILAKNTIDFNNYRDSKPEKIKEKILEFIQKEDEKPSWDFWMRIEYRGLPVILLKNIDKAKQKEDLEELVLSLFDPQKFDLWKYKKEIEVGQKKESLEIVPDLSKFIFLATASTANSQFPQKLQDKLNPVKPLLDKYFWIIFFFSFGIEIVIFYWLVKSRRKSKSKVLKHLEY
jgi:hypothetical protein